VKFFFLEGKFIYFQASEWCSFGVS